MGYFVALSGAALPFSAEVIPALLFLLDASRLYDTLDLQCGSEPEQVKMRYMSDG